MGSSGIVRSVLLLLNPLVPIVAVAVECTLAVAIDYNIVTAQDESSGVILVSNVERVVEPVINIGTPLYAISEHLQRS